MAPQLASAKQSCALLAVLIFLNENFSQTSRKFLEGKNRLAF